MNGRRKRSSSRSGMIEGSSKPTIWRWFDVLAIPFDHADKLRPLLLPLHSQDKGRKNRRGVFEAMTMGSSPAATVLVLVMCCLLCGGGAAVEGGLIVELVTPSVSLGSDAQKLQVSVTSSDGSPAPAATVALASVHSVASDSPVSISEQSFASIGDGKYELGLSSSDLFLGKYKLRIDASSDDDKGFLDTVIAVTAPISVSNVKVGVVEGDSVLPESDARLEFKQTTTLSATHLQKLKLAFEVSGPSGALFKPQQVMLKLRGESGVEQTFLIKSSTGNSYELTLDFTKLVEKLNHQSGVYTVDLIVGDDVMENSFLWTLASLDLDLPEGPEGASSAPVSKFGPKPEISHIFRQPEKRPPTYLSMAFLVLTLLPLVGFFVALLQLGVNLKNLPSGGLPLAAAAGFHGGIASILVLYLMFWLKLNLFTTLQVLGFLGLLTLVPGFNILSYLANLSSASKVKTS